MRELEVQIADSGSILTACGNFHEELVMRYPSPMNCVYS
jgi:hypothetical protein